MMHVAAEVTERAKKVHIRNPSRKKAEKVRDRHAEDMPKMTTVHDDGEQGVHQRPPTPRYVPRDLVLISRSTRYLRSVR
jgi:hypothetical protein